MHTSHVANFEQFLAKMAKMVKIIKKALGTFFSCLQALTNCKVSEKSNERFPIKSVAHGRTDVLTYGRTDVRMDVRTRLLRSQRPVGRETKNGTIPMNQSEEKWEKPHFKAFLRGLRGIRGD